MAQLFQNQGQVSQISAREWFDARRGQNIVLHSFQIAGSNRWYRTGVTSPPFSQGDFVSFQNDEKGNVKIDTITQGNTPIQATQVTPAQPLSQGPTTPAAGGGQSRDGYWAQKEQRDLEKDARYQNEDIPRMTFSGAHDRAVRLVAVALANDCISFGSMKKGDKLDHLMEMVTEITNRFFLEAINSPERLKYLREMDEIPWGDASEKASDSSDESVEVD